jgi:ribosome-associated protein
LFDVVHSPSLTEAMRARLQQTLASRLDGAGVLAIAVQDSRSQYQNRQLALVRLQRLLANGLRTPKQRRKTKPGRGAVERRLAAKKRHSQIKATRRQDREYP